MTNREFDIVVFGASGFTGRLVAEYLSREYADSDLRWAMAGRNEAKLAEVRGLIGASEETPLVIANTNDPSSIEAMVARTKLVLTTTGPYQLYGSGLVAACATAGTDYVDLSGEPGWMYEMIAAHDGAAKASGARIVHSCGFDSIPFDLGVFFLQKAAQEKFGKPVQRVRGRVVGSRGGLSGGTAASFNATMAALKKTPELVKVLANPFSLCEGFQGPAQPADNKPYEDAALGQWVAPFMMAAINTKNVHRSNFLLGHAFGTDFEYDEMVMTGAGDEGKAAAEFVASTDPFGGDVPKPGEGPSKEERETGFYDLLFVGHTVDGDEIRARVIGDRDPGYGSTSKMIAESALCLVKDMGGQAGGVLTPGGFMGDQLMKRLVDHAGLTFDIVE